MNMRMVIKIGGSVICPKEKIDLKFIKEISRAILELSKEHKLILITGSGRAGKNYIKVARELGASEYYLDLIGIDASRSNARILISALGKYAYSEPVKNLAELTQALKSDKVVVMGGLTPKQTTDAVAVKAAGVFKANFVLKITDVKGIYDKDPDKYKDARIFDHISSEELLNMIKHDKFIAGRSPIVDPVAVKIIQKSKILMVVLGSDVENMKRFIHKRKYIGTLID